MPFMAEYLLDCIAANPHAGDDFVHEGFEAGHALQLWLKHLVRIPEATPIITSVATKLADLYRTGDQHVRTRIEQAALEHILEKPRYDRSFPIGMTTGSCAKHTSRR